MRRLLPLMSMSSAVALVACGGPAPDGVGLGPDGATTVDDLVPSVGGASDLSEYKVRWYVNGVRRIDLEDEPMVPAALTNKGEEWKVGIATLSGNTPGDFGEATLTIANSPPTAELVAAPAEPKTADPLRTVVQRYDADAGEVAIRYEWTRDGTAVDFTGNVLPPDLTAKGEVWEVTVIPSDDEGDGEPQSASLTIGNTAPSVRRASIDPAFPTGADTLNCVGDGWSDADNDAPGYTVRWVSGGEVVGTEPTFVANLLDRGDTVNCELTPFDGDDAGAPVNSIPAEIGNSRPTANGVSISPDPATRADSLSVEIADLNDFDEDPITLTYRWTVNGSAVSTEPTLEPRFYKRGDEVQVTVVPNDGFVNGPSASSPAIVIGNTPPIITALTLNLSDVYTDDVIRATATGTDLDRDEFTINYEWFVNGTSFGTGQTIDGAVAFDKGDTVYVEVTPNDGDDGDVVTSDTLTVLNSLPLPPVVDITPEDPEIGDEAVCAVTTASTDPDGDTVTYSFAWTLNGTAFTGTSTTTYTGDTLPSGTTATDELYRCEVTPNDGTEDGPADSAILSFKTGPFEFTNCGKTGQNGPSQSDCDTEYFETALDGAVTVTSGQQTFFIPVTGTYRIKAAGAQGSSGGSFTGGCGATIQGDYDFSSGDEISVIVGQMGQNDGCSGAGGGGSFVLDDAGDEILIAGGGGGIRTSASMSGCGGRTTEYGGSGSGSSSRSSCGAKTVSLGAGGATTGGGWGSAGAGIGGNGADDYAGCGGKSPANGATGGGTSSYTAYGGFGGGGAGNGGCGGGGGGGYSGGDGGYIAGGGGSYNDGANQVNTAGNNCTHGYVTIEKLPDET